jgi:L-fuconolactonase
VIDAHQHFWRLGANDCTWPTAAEGAIHRDFLPEDWPGGDSILVQSQESTRDTAWLLELAERHDFILGVVGWSDFASPLPDSPWLKGLRPMVQGYADNWYDRFDPGAMIERGLVLDALVRPRHLVSLERLARRHPGLRIVIDHGGKPGIASGDLGGWQLAMETLAALPNVACKLSGLLTEAAPGQQEQVARVGEWLFETFGLDRLIWGSDWPIVTLAASYDEWLDLARSITPAAPHAAVFEDNARRIYRL